MAKVNTKRLPKSTIGTRVCSTLQDHPAYAVLVIERVSCRRLLKRVATTRRSNTMLSDWTSQSLSFARF